MRLSNKSTFSLVCLILLLAFVAVPVMAHAPDDTSVGPHTHPVKVDIPEVPAVGNTPAVPAVPDHNHHPVVTSIALKAAAAKVRGNMVVVGAAANTPSTTHATVDPNEFILIVTFDRPVVADQGDADQDQDGNGTIDDADALAILALADITHGVRDKMNALLATQTDISIQTVAWSGTDYDAFEVKVRAVSSAIPTGMGADATETVRLGVSIAGGVVHSPEMSEPSTTNPNLDVTYDGGDNLQSAIYSFVLVESLPTLGPPTITITGPTTTPANQLTMGEEATINLSVTGAAAGQVLLDGRITVTLNGTALTDTTFDAATGDLKFTPNAAGPLVVRVAAGAVTSADVPPAPNAVTVQTFTVVDRTPPVVTFETDSYRILSTGGESVYRARFYIDFNEALSAPLTRNHLSLTGRVIRWGVGFGRVSSTPQGVAQRYAVDFVGTAGEEVSVNLSSDSNRQVMDAAGNVVVVPDTAHTLQLPTPILVTITPITDVKSLDYRNNNEVVGEIGPHVRLLEFKVESEVNSIGTFQVNDVDFFDRNVRYIGANEWRIVADVGQATDTITIWMSSRSNHQGYQLRLNDNPETTDDDADPINIAEFRVEVDRYGPRVTSIRSSTPLPTDGGEFYVTITFDEELAAMPTADNFDVTNGSISDIRPVSGTATYSAVVTPDHGVEKDATDTTKQDVEIRLKDNVMDEHGNRSVATAADATADGSFTPLKATIAPPTAAVLESPTAGGDIMAGDAITLTFDKDPGTVTASVGTVAGSGTEQTVTIPDTQAEGTLALTLSWDNDGTATLNYTVVVNRREPATANSSAAIDVPGESFVIVVRDLSAANSEGLDFSATAPNATVVEWPGMPDLNNLFDTDAPHGGGVLILTESAAQPSNKGRHPGTVGISEIMWALDDGFFGDGALRDRASQWIELHNLNTNQNRLTPVPANPDDGNTTVVLSWKTGAQDIATDTAINGNLAAGHLDVVTNVFHDRPGNPLWTAPGSNGDTIAGKDFVSMARKGTFSLSSVSGNPARHNQRYTRTGIGNAGHSPDGRNKDQWGASTNAYLRFRTGLQGDAVRIAYEFVGTPGRVNTFSPERATVRDARTDINPSGIYINEVANRLDVDNQYEWIELRNDSDADININNYQISMLKGVGNEKPFIFLRNAGDVIPAGGVLLLVDSDPYGNPNHPLAVGWDIAKNPEDQIPGLAGLGISNTSKHGRYLVVKFGEHSDNSSGLPDDGNFILVVRRPDNHESDHGHKDKGRADLPTDQASGDRDLDKIVDIAGYVGGLSTGLGYKNAVSQTNLWPLKQQGAPDDRNRLTASKVRLRQHVSTRDGRAGTGNTHNDRKPGQIAFGDIGYSGIGYKRQAANSPIHGGTPGYDNGAQKGKVLDLATDKLVISELMLSQGPENARTTLPQWIEIYNPSPHPVHLGGWRLIIENPRDPIRTINLGSGSVKTILSEQTILVISGSAREIGSDTLPSSTVFPETRVYNVYKHQRNEFDMDSRFDPILNEEAFRITLIDGTALDTSKADQQPDVAGGVHLRVSGKYYAISDAVGNLDGDPRTNDTPEDNGNEAFKKGMTEDGIRTSLIRIFDNGVARDGTGAVKPLGGTAGVGVARMKGVDPKYSWVHAADAAGRFVRHTWYGDETDWGTPNNRAGQVLPVSLSHFRPTLEDGKVVVRWTTESELDNAGFNILRSDTRNGEFAQVNDKLIQGKGTTGERSTYSWVDATAKPGVVYYYQIEDVSFAGERQTLRTTKLKGYISAENKLTTTWGDLKEVQ